MIGTQTPLFSRRELLQMSAAAALTSPLEAEAQTTERPNILVFLTDDHGQWASRCYGNSELQTPTLDFLAATGARMTNAYTPSPVCSPARACFFTGRLPSQHGVHDWINEQKYPKNWMAGETTLPTLLKGGGYHTGLVGKWHCGMSWEPQAGFDYYLSHNKDQYPHKGECKFAENGKPVVHNGYRAPFLTQKAIEFIERRDKARPFFLTVGYVDTHSPFKDHPERLVRQYRKVTFRDIPKETYVGPGKARFAPPKPEVHREQLAQYYASVSNIDANMGTILDYLDGNGLLDNTLIVYTSDHGHNNGHHGINTKGNATVPQNFYEESIRIPMLLRLPKRIEAGLVTHIPVNHCDLFKTVLDAANVTEKAADATKRNSPGESFLPVIGQNNRVHEWRSDWYCEYGNARMIRTPEHKLIVRYSHHAEQYGDELYDLQADLREIKNVIKEPAHKQTLESLRARLEKHFGRYETPEYSAKRGRDLPRCSDVEPWHLG